MALLTVENLTKIFTVGKDEDLIADEPTAGLDATIQRQVLDLTRALAEDADTPRHPYTRHLLECVRV